MLTVFYKFKIFFTWVTCCLREMASAMVLCLLAYLFFFFSHFYKDPFIGREVLLQVLLWNLLLSRDFSFGRAFASLRIVIIVINFTSALCFTDLCFCCSADVQLMVLRLI